MNMTSGEIDRLVNNYIGVKDGYLGDFSIKSHHGFYTSFDLDIDPDQYEGTTKERFIQILSQSNPDVQAQIIRGILDRYPAESSPLRTQQRFEKFTEIATRLEGGKAINHEIKTTNWIVDPTVIAQLARASENNPALDFDVLLRLCEEINSCFAHEDIVATVLLMRTVLNYVPPAFGHDTFKQVTAQSGRSLKSSFEYLEEGLRKIADFHTHRKMAPGDLYPTMAQVEPYKPQFEVLLQQVVERVTGAP